MAPRNKWSNAGSGGDVTAPMNPTNPTFSEGSSSGSSSGSSFTGITDPEALATLLNFIKQAASGGSADYKAQRATRNAQVVDTQKIRNDYSKEAAFSDAAMLMKKNLEESMAKALPAISRAIQGAGTSASSMQGLLAQDAASAAVNAGAAGAEQAKSYGNISTGLSSVLEALTRVDSTQEQALLGALGLLRNSTSTQSSTQSSSQRGGGGGGGGGGGSAPRSNGFAGGGFADPAIRESNNNNGVDPGVSLDGGDSFIRITPSNDQGGSFYDDPYIYGQDWGNDWGVADNSGTDYYTPADLSSWNEWE